MANVRGTRGTNKPVIEKIVPSAGWTEDSNTHYLLVDLPGFKKEQVQLQVLRSGHIKVSGERVTNQKKTVGFEQTYKIPGAENSDLNNVRAKFDGEILYVTIPKKPEEVKKIDEEEEEKEKEKEEEEKKKKKNDNRDHEENNNTEQQKPEDQVVKNDQEAVNNTQQQQNPDDQAVKKHQEAVNNTQLQQKPAINDEVIKNKELGGEDDQINSSKIKEEKLLKKGNESMRFSEEDVKKWEDDGDNCLRNTVKMLSQNRGIILTAVVAFSLGFLLSRRFRVGH